MDNNIKKIVDKLKKVNKLNLKYKDKLEVKEKEYASLENEIDSITDILNNLYMKRKDYILNKCYLYSGGIGVFTGSMISFIIYLIIKFYFKHPIMDLTDIFFILLMGVSGFLCSFITSYLILEYHFVRNSSVVKEMNEDIMKQKTLYSCKEKELGKMMDMVNELNRRIDMNNSLIYDCNKKLIDEYQMEHDSEMESYLNNEDLQDDIKCEREFKKRILNK